MINGQLLDVENITGLLTIKSGFQIVDGAIYKQGKHIFGNINLKGNLTAGEQVRNAIILPFSLPVSYVNGGFSTNRDQWAIPNGFCYIFIGQNGGINLNSNIDATFTRFHIDVITT